ncbi:hypothetical protein RHMOL_Rhmol03G0059100 [Rhododendron molle]|uniref:Uncharacterized protein n=1 Tax=Rhododendron molle TaxID=49168 RepID=A0ACC0PB67_RHOML|nr:hypothetical protein RHMOL_Rhmol03G0059100 [Rhododendron molle]
METKNGSSLSYEDFEPFCNWRRNDESETLVAHLPAFRKDQLKIQVNNTTNTVKISGERLVDETKRSRFHKEIAIPKDCNSKEIHARFAGGLLHVVMPKKGPPAPQQELISTTTQIQQPSASKQSAPRNISQDQATKLPTLPEPACNTTEKIGLLNNRTLKTATNVAVMVALVAGLGAYIMYSYRSLYIED